MEAWVDNVNFRTLCLWPNFHRLFSQEGEVPKLGEVNFSFNALPKRGPRPDMTKHKASEYSGIVFIFFET